MLIAKPSYIFSSHYSCYIGPGWLSWYRDKLRSVRSGNRILVEKDFPHPSIRALGSTQPPVQCVSGLFPSGLSGTGPGVEQPPQSSTEFKESVKVYYYSPSQHLWPVLKYAFTVFLSFVLNPMSISSFFTCSRQKHPNYNALYYAVFSRLSLLLLP